MAANITLAAFCYTFYGMKSPFRITLVFLILAIGVFLGYPRNVQIAPEMNIIVKNLDGTPAADIEVVRSLKSHKIINNYKTENPVRTDGNGVVKISPYFIRLPLVFQGMLWVKAWGLRGMPYTGGRINARDDKDHTLWDDVGFDEDDCCPSILTLQQKDFELRDELFYR